MEKKSDEYYKKIINQSKIRTNLSTKPKGKSVLTMNCVFKYNYQDIKNKFEEVQNPEEIITRMKNYHLDFQTKKLFIQLLFNYFISAHSFLLHIKDFVENPKQEKEEKYLRRYNTVKVKIKNLYDSNLAHFIKCFRDYIVHEGLPLLKSKVYFEVKESSENRIEKINNIFIVDIKQLLKNDVFDTKAKKYLKNLDNKEEFNLIDIVDKVYRKCIDIFDIFKFEMMKNQIDKANNMGFFVDEEGNKIE